MKEKKNVAPAIPAEYFEQTSLIISDNKFLLVREKRENGVIHGALYVMREFNAISGDGESSVKDWQFLCNTKEAEASQIQPGGYGLVINDGLPSISASANDVKHFACKNPTKSIISLEDEKALQIMKIRLRNAYSEITFRDDNIALTMGVMLENWRKRHNVSKYEISKKECIRIEVVTAVEEGRATMKGLCAYLDFIAQQDREFFNDFTKNWRKNLGYLS